MAPTKQHAVVLTGDANLIALKDAVPVPIPGPDQVLIKIVAAAQNPTDWKTARRSTATVGAISGCDFAGIVEEIGSAVPVGTRTIGERVAGFISGGSSGNGAFAEYLVTRAQFGILPIPEGWSFEDAAQLGIAGFTALQTLYESHQDLPTPLAPTSTPLPLLVSGGSTSVGQYVVQFASQSGLRVIATASPANFELVKSLGADEVYDYHDPDVAQKIKAATDGKLKHAVDTVAEGDTPQLVSGALSDEGGVVAIILSYESPRPGVRTVSSNTSILLGKEEKYRERGLKFAKLYRDILDKGQIKPNPLLIFPNGLASVPDGFKYMIDGKVSAQKITYRISDTPNI